MSLRFARLCPLLFVILFTLPDSALKKFDESKGSKKGEIELEFKKLKKDFDFTKFKEGR